MAGNAIYDIAEQAEALRVHYSYNSAAHCWLTPDEAPLAAVTDVATDAEFLMQGSGTPNLEIPYRVGPLASSIRVATVLAVPRGQEVAKVSIKIRSQTLVTSVTTATSSATRAYGGFGIVPPESMSGWGPAPGQLWSFLYGLTTHTPADLNTSRVQAIGAFARYDAENDNIIGSGGDTAIDVYMVSMNIQDVGATPLSQLDGG